MGVFHEVGLLPVVIPELLNNLKVDVGYSCNNVSLRSTQ